MARKTEKPFEYFEVIIKLDGQRFKHMHMTADQMNKLKSIPYDGVNYKLDKAQVWNLNGWYPWLKETRNPWRITYNMLYRYFVPVAVMVLEADHV